MNTKESAMTEPDAIKRARFAVRGRYGSDAVAVEAGLICELIALASLPDSAGEAGPVASTPSAKWRVSGEPDPHAGHYDCERAKLCMGQLTDDELANGAFMNYDQPLNIQGILAGTHFSPIAWMTAVQDRIRWLSRSLESALAAPHPVGSAPEIEKLKTCWYTSPDRGKCRKCGQVHAGVIDETGVEQASMFTLAAVKGYHPGVSGEVKERLDDMAVWRQACDVRNWANTLGTVLENKDALLRSIDRLRAMVAKEASQ